MLAEGTLRVRCSPLVAVLDDLGLETRDDDEVLVLAGRVSPSPGASWSLALVGRAAQSPGHALDVADDGSFATALPLRTTLGREITGGSLELSLTRTLGESAAPSRCGPGVVR